MIRKKVLTRVSIRVSMLVFEQICPEEGRTEKKLRIRTKTYTRRVVESVFGSAQHPNPGQNIQHSVTLRIYNYLDELLFTSVNHISIRWIPTAGDVILN